MSRGTGPAFLALLAVEPTLLPGLLRHLGWGFLSALRVGGPTAVSAANCTGAPLSSWQVGGIGFSLREEESLLLSQFLPPGGGQAQARSRLGIGQACSLFLVRCLFPLRKSKRGFPTPYVSKVYFCVWKEKLYWSFSKMGNLEQGLKKEVPDVYVCAFLTVSDSFPSIYSASSHWGPGIRGGLASTSAGCSQIPVILISRVRGPWYLTCLNL